jgi:cobalamin biosynthesis Mg chelatase CobN
MDGAVDEENHATAAAAGATTQAKDEARPATTRGSALVEEATRAATTLNDKLPTLSQESHASGNHKAAPEREPQQAREDVRSSVAASHAPQSFGREESIAESGSIAESVTAGTKPAAQGETRGRLGRRAASVGASVGETVRPRVEKLREASTVVFDEATDDPGLRFVIVAAVLFLLFLFILLFSYILG